MVTLTALYKRAPPEVNDIVPEGSKAFAVGWDRVIREVSANHLPQPFSLDRNRPLSAIWAKIDLIYLLLFVQQTVHMQLLVRRRKQQLRNKFVYYGVT